MQLTEEEFDRRYEPDCSVSSAAFGHDGRLETYGADLIRTDIYSRQGRVWSCFDVADDGPAELVYSFGLCDGALYYVVVTASPICAGSQNETGD